MIEGGGRGSSSSDVISDITTSSSASRSIGLAQRLAIHHVEEPQHTVFDSSGSSYSVVSQTTSSSGRRSEKPERPATASSAIASTAVLKSEAEDGSPLQDSSALEGGAAFSEFWSVGSSKHETGDCVPCLFLKYRSGCINGADCNFCHKEHLMTKKSHSQRPCKSARAQCKVQVENFVSNMPENPEDQHEAVLKLTDRSPYMRKLLRGVFPNIDDILPPLEEDQKEQSDEETAAKELPRSKEKLRQGRQAVAEQSPVTPGVQPASRQDGPRGYVQGNQQRAKRKPK